MNGTICQSSCVTQVENLATCNKDCTDKSGEGVFVNDKGVVHPIAKESQGLIKSNMGKQVKIKAVPTELDPVAPPDRGDLGRRSGPSRLTAHDNSQ
jgi:hypothetical protein